MNGHDYGLVRKPRTRIRTKTYFGHACPLISDQGYINLSNLRFIYNTSNSETRRRSIVEFANKTNSTLSESDLNAFELSFEAERQKMEYAKKVTYRQNLKLIQEFLLLHVTGNFRKIN